MPKFVNYVDIKPTKSTKKEVSELDDEFHRGKFRTKESKEPLPQDH